MSKVPDKGGFYWARWMISTDDTPKAIDYTPGPYEPVELCFEGTGKDEVGYVELIANPHRQPADNFYWGQRLNPPERVSPDLEMRRDKTNSRAYREYLAMTPQQREDFIMRRNRENKEKKR